jgi:hypothetical protein
LRRSAPAHAVATRSSGFIEPIGVENDPPQRAKTGARLLDRCPRAPIPEANLGPGVYSMVMGVPQNSSFRGQVGTGARSVLPMVQVRFKSPTLAFSATQQTYRMHSSARVALHWPGPARPPPGRPGAGEAHLTFGTHGIGPPTPFPQEPWDVHLQGIAVVGPDAARKESISSCSQFSS